MISIPYNDDPMDEKRAAWSLYQFANSFVSISELYHSHLHSRDWNDIDQSVICEECHNVRGAHICFPYSLVYRCTPEAQLLRHQLVVAAFI